MIAFLKKDKSFMTAIESGFVPLQEDRDGILLPIGVALVRGIEEGLVSIQGNR